MKNIFYFSLALLSFTSLWGMRQKTYLTANQVEQLVYITENSSTSAARSILLMTEQPTQEVERERREKLLRLQVKCDAAITDQEREHYLDQIEKLESRACKQEEIRATMVAHTVGMPDRLLTAAIAMLGVSDQNIEAIAQRIKDIVIYKSQLFAALDQNNEQKIRLLLQKVPYMLKDQDGNTLLHTAVRNCSSEIIGLLLKLDTKAIMVKNKQGQTPIDVALIYNRMDIVELFTKLACSKPKSYFACSIV